MVTRQRLLLRLLDTIKDSVDRAILLYNLIVLTIIAITMKDKIFLQRL